MPLISVLAKAIGNNFLGADVSYPTLKLLVEGNSNVGILSVYKIERYMGKELKDMFLE